MGEFTGKWAIITLHPSLPSKSEQLARARAWGVTESLIDHCDTNLVIDDVRRERRTTKWSDKLPRRAEFIADMTAFKPPEGAVFFATPLCVGFGRAHAEETIEALWSAGLAVYVHSVGALYRAGDDMEEFLDTLESEANTAYVRAHRARQKRNI